MDTFQDLNVHKTIGFNPYIQAIELAKHSQPGLVVARYKTRHVMVGNKFKMGLDGGSFCQPV